MRLIYDPAKNEPKLIERGLAFDLAEHYERSTALIAEDTRQH